MFNCLIVLHVTYMSVGDDVEYSVCLIKERSTEGLNSSDFTFSKMICFDTFTTVQFRIVVPT